MEVSRRYSTATRPCFSGYKELVVPRPTYQYVGWSDPPRASRVVEEPCISRGDFNLRLVHTEHTDVQAGMCGTPPTMSPMTNTSPQAGTDTTKPVELPPTSPREDAECSPRAENKTTPPSKGKKKPYRRHAKPPVSYTAMIAAVIQESPEKKLTLLQIVDELKRRYSFFNGDYKGWKNSVRHNLSLNKCFVKVPRDADRPFGKDNYWMVDGIESYLNPDGTFRQRRKRAQTGAVATKTVARGDSEEPRAKKAAKGKKLPRCDRQNSADADNCRSEPNVEAELETKETEQQPSKATAGNGKVDTVSKKTEKFRSPYAIDTLLSPRDVTDGLDHSPVLYYLSPRYTHRPIPEQTATDTRAETTWPSNETKSPEKRSCDENNIEPDTHAPQNNATSVPGTPAHAQTFNNDKPVAESEAWAQWQVSADVIAPVRATAEGNTTARCPEEHGSHAEEPHQYSRHVSGPPPPLHQQPTPPWSVQDAPPSNPPTSWEGGVDSPFPSFRASFHPNPAVASPRCPPWLAPPDRSLHSSYGFELPSFRPWVSPGSSLWPSPTWSPGGGSTSPMLNVTRPLTESRFTSTPYPQPHSFPERSNSSLSEPSHYPVISQHQYIPVPPSDGMAPTPTDAAYGNYNPSMVTQVHHKGFPINQPALQYNGCSNTRPDFKPPVRPGATFGTNGPPSPRGPGIYPPYMLPARSLHLIEPVPRHLSYVYHTASANCTCRLCVEAFRTGPLL